LFYFLFKPDSKLGHDISCSSAESPENSVPFCDFWTSANAADIVRAYECTAAVKKSICSIRLRMPKIDDWFHSVRVFLLLPLLVFWKYIAST
jgi:hypothetical protein